MEGKKHVCGLHGCASVTSEFAVMEISYKRKKKTVYLRAGKHHLHLLIDH